MKRKLFCLVIILFIALPAWAIVSTKFTIYDETAVTADGNGDGVSISPSWSGSGQTLILRLSATNNSGTTPTLDVDVQHSPDCSTWATLAGFTQVTTGSASEDIHITSMTSGVFPCLRAVIDVGGTSPNYDINVAAYLD